MKERERLFTTVEEIRAADFPELDADLVREILTIQVQMQEDRGEGQRRTDQAISRWASVNASNEPMATDE